MLDSGPWRQEPRLVALWRPGRKLQSQPELQYRLVIGARSDPEGSSRSLGKNHYFSSSPLSLYVVSLFAGLVLFVASGHLTGVKPQLTFRRSDTQNVAIRKTSQQDLCTTIAQLCVQNVSQHYVLTPANNSYASACSGSGMQWDGNAL